MNPSAPKVAVGTLTWNQKSDVLECLDSLIKLDYPNFEIVVIDNGSADGTGEAIREKFPRVQIVRNAENVGCSEGLNGEIRYALQVRADYLFIIGNDAKVEPSTLTELVRVAEKDPRIGVTFPKVYYWASNRRIWFAKGARVKEIDWLRGRFTGFVQNVEDDGRFEAEEEAELYPNGFCLVRMEAVRKAGFHDPGYFIFFEDADWLLRIHQAGYTGRYVPRARAWHKPSSSIGMESESFYYYRTRNRLFFFQRHCPRQIFPLFMFYFLFEHFLRTLPGLYRSGKKAQAIGAFLGFLDFLREKRGRRSFAQGERVSLGCWLRRVGKKVLREPLARMGAGVRRRFKQRSQRPLHIRLRAEWNLGDEVMLLPVFEALKCKYPSCTIEAMFRYPELLDGNPHVDRPRPDGKRNPELSINLHREKRGRSRLDYLCEILDVDTLPLPRLYLQPEEIAKTGNRWPLTEGRLHVGLTPSAKWFSRQWEREKWIALARHLMEVEGAEVIVLGKEEAPLPIGINCIGDTTVREAAILLSRLNLFVGSDSGLVHLALAVGTPTVGLYGPLNPSFLVAERPGFIPIWSEIECRGCWSDGRMPHPDHCPKVRADCMESISLSRVIGACETLLASRAKISPLSGRK